MSETNEEQPVRHDMPIVLVVRNPDFANEYTVEGSVRIIDIDLGANFNGLKNIAADMGIDDAREHVQGWRDEVSDLPQSSVVRANVDALADEASEYIEAAERDDGPLRRMSNDPRRPD